MEDMRRANEGSHPEKWSKVSAGSLAVSICFIWAAGSCLALWAVFVFANLLFLDGCPSKNGRCDKVAAVHSIFYSGIAAAVWTVGCMVLTFIRIRRGLAGWFIAVSGFAGCVLILAIGWYRYKYNVGA